MNWTERFFGPRLVADLKARLDRAKEDADKLAEAEKMRAFWFDKCGQAEAEHMEACAQLREANDKIKDLETQLDEEQKNINQMAVYRDEYQPKLAKANDQTAHYKNKLAKMIEIINEEFPRMLGFYNEFQNELREKLEEEINRKPV